MMWIFALALAAVVAGCGGARAAALDDIENWYRQAQSQIESWLHRSPSGHPDVIVPPAGIDPHMAMMPPANGARMPVVRPPGSQSPPAMTPPAIPAPVVPPEIGPK